VVFKEKCCYQDKETPEAMNLGAAECLTRGVNGFRELDKL
jgi:hypothetical protein